MFFGDKSGTGKLEIAKKLDKKQQPDYSQGSAGFSVFHNTKWALFTPEQTTSVTSVTCHSIAWFSWDFHPYDGFNLFESPQWVVEIHPIQPKQSHIVSLVSTQVMNPIAFWYTLGSINGWNLPPWPIKTKENDLNQTSMGKCSMLIFRGVTNDILRSKELWTTRKTTRNFCYPTGDTPWKWS